MTHHHDAVSSYPDLDGVEEGTECPGAEQEDLGVTGNVFCAGVVDVGQENENVAGGNGRDLLAASPLWDTAGALNVKCGLGSGGEERGQE
jgi:hypothetical protein